MNNVDKLCRFECRQQCRPEPTHPLAMSEENYNNQARQDTFAEEENKNLGLLLFLLLPRG